MPDEEKILVICPYEDCEAKFNLAKTLSGRKVKCFHCHRRFIVGKDGVPGRKLDKADASAGPTVSAEALEPISGATEKKEEQKAEPAAPDGDDPFGGLSLDVSADPQPPPGMGLDLGGSPDEEFKINVPPGGVNLGLGEPDSGGGDDMFGSLSIDAPKSPAPAESKGVKGSQSGQSKSPAAVPPRAANLDLGLGEPKQDDDFGEMTIDAPKKEPKPEAPPEAKGGPGVKCPACGAPCQPGQTGCLVCGASLGGKVGEGGKKIGGSKVSKRQLIAALVILCPLIGILTFRYTASSQLNSQIAEIGKEGIPTNFAELQQSYSVADGTENAAGLYAQAFEIFESSTESPFSGIPLPIPSRPIPDETDDQVRKILDATKQAFILIHDAGTKAHCSYPVDLSKGLLAETSHLSKIESAILALQWQATYLAHRRNARGATQTVIDSLRLAESLSNEPLTRSHLVYAKGVTTTVDTLAQVLSRVEHDTNSLAMLQSAFTKAETTLQESLATAVGGELALGAELSKMSDEDLKAQLKDFGDLGSVSTLYNLSGAKLHDVRALISKHRETIQAAKNNYVTSFKDLDVKAEPGINPSQPLTSKLANHSPLWAANGRALMALRLAQVAVGLEGYAAKNGDPPELIEELVPEFINAVPQDVFNGESVRYKKQEQGFSLFSVGNNHTFDMGHVEEDIPLIVSTQQRKKGSTRTRTQLTGPEAEARNIYSQFKSYLLNKKSEEAKKFHDQLIAQYPDSEYAQKAKIELDEQLGPTELPAGDVGGEITGDKETKKEEPKADANEKKARAMLQLFKSYMLNNKPDLAKVELKKLEREFPDSIYYEEAKDAFENAKK
ncbi:MAG: hypothetical protein O3B01_20495 [Planctomycetota bacterium]|nr:hypothetical protein [Planctomycetota bacterium]MDA1140952.1 hypothetical protein [Planctomycetota bacterium]